MSYRAVIKVIISAAVLLFAAFGTVRARQVWSESQAHARLERARSESAALISRVRAQGVLPSELAPYMAQASRLQQTRASEGTPLWSPDGARFYDAQSGAYQTLTAKVRALVVRVTASTRSTAKREVSGLRDTITRADSLDVDSTSARRVLVVQTKSVTTASTPGQYRAVSQASASATRELSVRSAAQERYVNAVVAAAHSDLRSIVAGAAQEADSATQQVSLLGLYATRADAYRTAFAKDLSAVQSATNAFAAAVKESHIHSDLAIVQADFAKTVPHKVIVVSTENQSATMYDDGKQVYETPVTTGGPELPTDHGIFHIYEKISPFTFHSPWPPGSPYYYPPTDVQYWMPFEGGEGLHDASWRSNFGPGSNFAPTDLGTGNTILGTHGCVNLPAEAAQFVWDWAPVGTSVVVT